METFEEQACTGWDRPMVGVSSVDLRKIVLSKKWQLPFKWARIYVDSTRFGPVIRFAASFSKEEMADIEIRLSPRRTQRTVCLDIAERVNLSRYGLSRTFRGGGSVQLLFKEVPGWTHGQDKQALEAEEVRRLKALRKERRDAALREKLMLDQMVEERFEAYGEV